ncbi:hypothetical protein RvY_04726 [Ramazzottius varieornatus]|uniref:Uncharacterized protein n=1 Tax=Ramazzottius varieornatus TaxID=947166 RepID=A0A1D1UZA3_RAMVA|nr:hypothetical protein RvY_04726 [Ramazzottius varieornatus]
MRVARSSSSKFTTFSLYSIMNLKMVLIPLSILTVVTYPTPAAGFFDKLLIAAKGLAPGIVTEVGPFAKSVFGIFRQYCAQENMADDQLAQRFIDLTMQLYDNMEDKCKKDLDPLQDDVELLEENIKTLHTIVYGMVVGFVVAFALFLAIVVSLCKKADREKRLREEFSALAKKPKKPKFDVVKVVKFSSVYSVISAFYSRYSTFQVRMDYLIVKDQ